MQLCTNMCESMIEKKHHNELAQIVSGMKNQIEGELDQMQIHIKEFSDKNIEIMKKFNAISAKIEGIGSGDMPLRAGSPLLRQ